MTLFLTSNSYKASSMPVQPRTKEAIEAAPAIITQYHSHDTQSWCKQHISRPSLWNNSCDDINMYWASYNIYVNWYNIHWACQTEGNFFVNVFRHFIEYSGYSIAQAVPPAAWENDRILVLMIYGLFIIKQKKYHLSMMML